MSKLKKLAIWKDKINAIREETEKKYWENGWNCMTIEIESQWSNWKRKQQAKTRKM